LPAVIKFHLCHSDGYMSVLDLMYCEVTVRPSAKVTIDSL